MMTDTRTPRELLEAAHMAWDRAYREALDERDVRASMTSRGLLEAALAETSDRLVIYANHIAATPSGAELLRRAEHFDHRELEAEVTWLRGLLIDTIEQLEKQSKSILAAIAVAEGG